MYSECGRKAQSVARLYRECFPASPHTFYETNLSVVKRLRETGCMTSRARSGGPAKVGRQVQSDEALTYTLAYPICSTRHTSEHCGHSKNQVWKILRKSGAYP